MPYLCRERSWYFATVFSNRAAMSDMAASAAVEGLVSPDLNWEMGICPEQNLTPQ